MFCHVGLQIIDFYKGGKFLLTNYGRYRPKNYRKSNKLMKV